MEQSVYNGGCQKVWGELTESRGQVEKLRCVNKLGLWKDKKCAKSPKQFYLASIHLDVSASG